MSDGLNVIVTGSASGLGAATAKILAKDGARLVINYASSKDDAEKTAEECRKLGAAEVIVVQGDVAKDEDCKRIVEAAAPGASSTRWSTMPAPPSTWRIICSINYRPTTSSASTRSTPSGRTRWFARRASCSSPAPRRPAGLAVVNVSSVAGISGIGSSIAYAASKGALNTMTLSLSRALAPNIRVNAICPGYIDTPWFTKGRGAEEAKQVRDMVVSRVPLKIASTAEDIAELVCFLATPKSSSMTGELVRMDAGMHLAG